MAIGSSSLNGSMPAIISYSRIPRVHQSTAFPCPSLRASTLVQQNFGGEVLGSAAESISSAVDNLGKTEIGQLQVAVGVDQQVLRLEVSVDHVLRV